MYVYIMTIELINKKNSLNTDQNNNIILGDPEKSLTLLSLYPKRSY